METSALLSVKGRGCQMVLDDVIFDSYILKSRGAKAIVHVQKSSLCHSFVMPDAGKMG